MKAKELIEILSQYDGNLEVRVDCADKDNVDILDVLYIYYKHEENEVRYLIVELDEQPNTSRKIR